MDNLGMGTMIRMLSGASRDSAATFVESIGKKIKEVKLENDTLKMTFTEDTGIAFSDHGQSCCEHRFMVCDDNLGKFVGAKLIGAEVLSAPGIAERYDHHDTQFLHVKTSKGVIVASNHNEHNGYYGGFSVEVHAL